MCITWFHGGLELDCSIVGWLLAPCSLLLSISHIFYEGNEGADQLANFGVTSQGSTWWDTILDFVREPFSRDRIGQIINLVSFSCFFNLNPSIVLFLFLR